MKETCAIRNCNNGVEFAFCRIENRSIIKESTYCRKDGTDFLKRYDAKSLSCSSNFQNNKLGPIFEVELVVIDRMEPNSKVFLRESDGPRRIEIAIGVYEAYSLRRQLDVQPTVRPLTHDAMKLLIEAMDGRVAFVVIDEYSTEHQYYSAKIHIERCNKSFIADVRPSDAITLAIVCDAPIVVSPIVLDIHQSNDNSHSRK